MNYGKILSRAWQVIWKYKILWLFGILASCGNNINNGSSGANSSGINYQYDSYNPPANLPPELYRFFYNMGDFFDRMSYQWGVWVGIFMLVIFLLIFITFAIRVYGQVGLVRGVLTAEKGQPEKLSLAEIHQEIKPFYWRLFGFQLLLFVVFFVLIGLIVAVVIAGSVLTLGIGLLCFLPMICLLFPVGLAVTLVIKQAVIAMLVDDLTIGEALSRGWNVVRSRAVDYLVMGLILIIGGWIIGLIFSLPQLFALAPLMSGILRGAYAEDWGNILSGLWISIACLVAYWPVLLVLRGVLNSYIETSWVLTYLEASGERAEPIQTEAPDQPDAPELLEPEAESA